MYTFLVKSNRILYIDECLVLTKQSSAFFALH